MTGERSRLIVQCTRRKGRGGGRRWSKGPYFPISNLPWSWHNQDRMVLATEHTLRSLEQNREPSYQYIQMESTSLWQMGKDDWAKKGESFQHMITD